MDINHLKKLASEKAVDEIKSGMVVGLGSGSTVQFALEEISGRIKNGALKNILCIPSSGNTEREAERLEIPLTTFEKIRLGREKLSVKGEREEGGESVEVRSQKSEIRNKNFKSLFTLHSTFYIDLTIDGADEVAVGHPELVEGVVGNPEPALAGEGSKQINLIKGGGGALLREKIVAQASKRLIIIVDESKMSNQLGEKWAVPVEVIPFAVSVEEEFLKSLGAKVTRRKKSDGSDYITDENNFILDSNFGVIKDPANLSIILHERAGIVEHGLFIGMADKIFCAKSSGIEVIERGPARQLLGR